MNRDKTTFMPTDRFIHAGGDVTNSVFVTGDNANVRNYVFSAPNSRAVEFLIAEIDETSLLVSQDYADKLQQIHESYRAGRVGDASDELRRIQTGDMWKRLTPQVRASLLRQMGRYELELKGDVDEVRELVASAKAIDPDSDDTLIRTMLRNAEAGAEAALMELGRPHDIAGFNLQLSLLLQAGKIEELLSVVQTPPERISPDEETCRFKALAWLMKGEIALAQTAIQVSLSKNPEWEMAHYAAAIVEYWSSISLCLSVPRLTRFPVPVELSLVKSDAGSLNALRQAEQRFARLAEKVQRGEGQRRSYETWRLACLANGRERWQEAQTYCQDLLAREATHCGAVLWGLARGFAVDFDRSAKALSDQFQQHQDEGHPFDIELTTTLLTLYLSAQRADDAENLLRSTKAQFTEADAGEVHLYWSFRTALAREDGQRAREVMAQADDRSLQSYLQTMLLEFEAHQSNNHQPLIDHLEQTLAETGEADYLFELCRLKAELQDWAYVAGQAQRLVADCGTAAAVYFACWGLWHNRQYGECLAALEANQARFPSQRLPEDLWRVKVGCLMERGRHTEAVETARALVQASNKTENLLVLLEAYFRQGDLPNLTVTARELVQRDDVKPESLVKAARLVTLNDQELARRLLRRVIPQVSERPELLGIVISTGFELNIENETAPLLRLVFADDATAQKDVWVIEAKDFPEQYRQWAGNSQRIARHYYQGEIPIHFFAERSNQLTLARLFHDLPEAHRRRFDPRHQLPLFIRHGSRVLNRQLVAGAAQWRLHLDMTALLLADSLELLDDITRCFGCVYLSPSTQSALTLQVDQLQYHQFSRLEACRVLLRLLEQPQPRLQVLPEVTDEKTSFPEPEMKLRVDLIARLKHARENSGVLVTFLPIKTLEQEEIEIPVEYQPYVVNSRSLVESLKERSVFNEEESETALDRLGSTGNAVEGVVSPALSTTLYLHSTLAGTLAAAGLLETLCDHFRVFVDADEIDRARADLAYHERQVQLQERLKRLMNRIREGLGNGAYQSLPLPDRSPSASDDERSAEPESQRPEMKCLRDLLLFQPQPGDVIWIDDRFINQHPTCGQSVPLIGINEVLLALRKGGKKITEAQYFEKLHKLRTGNFRYIPITEEEILYRLR